MKFARRASFHSVHLVQDLLKDSFQQSQSNMSASYLRLILMWWSPIGILIEEARVYSLPSHLYGYCQYTHIQASVNYIEDCTAAL